MADECKTLQLKCTPTLPRPLTDNTDYVEIGGEAEWVLSTCKPGYGVNELRDDNYDTYWQSDGSQPHLLSILFQRKMTISHVCIYSNVKLDESYTPNRIGIRKGANMCETVQICVAEVSLPNGWMVVPLSTSKVGPPMVRAFVLQIAILQNHQNGRDSHVRQVKIFGPNNKYTAGPVEFLEK